MITIQVDLPTRDSSRRNTLTKDDATILSHSDNLTLLVQLARDTTDEPIRIIGIDGRELGWLFDFEPN